VNINDHESIQNLIDQYLDESLSGQELVQFEAELAINKELQNLVAINKATRFAIKEQVLNDRLAMLKRHAASAHDSATVDKGITELKKPEQAKVNSTILIKIIGLSILITALGYFSFNHFFTKPDITKKPLPVSTPSNEPVVQNGEDNSNTTTIKTEPFAESNAPVTPEPIAQIENPTTKSSPQIKDFALLAAKYFITAKNLNAVFRGNITESTTQALKEYQAGKFENAFQALKNVDADDQSGQYLKAHTLYQLGNIKEATAIFNSFYEDEYSDYHFDATYDLLMCYLKAKPIDKAKCIKISKELLVKNSIKSEAVKVILAELTN
jgi:hypothetical protein